MFALVGCPTGRHIDWLCIFPRTLGEIQDPLGQSDHRTALTQLSDMFDWTLRQHIASRQRDLFMYTPSATPVQPRLYLLEDNPDVVSLEEIIAQKLRTQVRRARKFALRFAKWAYCAYRTYSHAGVDLC